MNAQSDLVSRLNIASWKLRFFRRYARRFIAKNFHSVRLLNAVPEKDTDRPKADAMSRISTIFADQTDNSGPLVIAANHPSWWDPMVAIFLAEKFAKQRRHYAPIEDVMLERYGIFKNLGFYGVEKDTAKGLKDFLHVGNHILEQADSVIWMTPEGNFTDPRVRPISIKKGLASLVSKNTKAKVLPLAIEYTFWNEKKPEILVHAGKLISAENIPSNDNPSSTLTKRLHEEIQTQMQLAIDDLASFSQQRNPQHFSSLLGGSAGVGGFYGWWQKLRGYDKEHMS